MHNISPLHMLLMMTLILSIIIMIFISATWLIGWIAGKIAHFHTPFAPFGWTALALIAILCLTLGYGYLFGRWRLDINHIEYSHHDIPASFDGYRIVHISDMHLSTFDDDPQKLERIVDSINAQKPDLICFTGDLVTLGAEELKPYIKTLKRLKATDGVMSVLGNHDFLIYARHHSPSSRENEVDELAQMEREALGWNLLRNEHAVIHRGNDSITIIGVDNQNCANQGFRTIARGDLKAASAGTSGFRILLSHDPSHWTGEVIPDTDIPLTLSGHTHAAQIRLFGWTPATLSFKETDGRYDKDGQTLYINVGLGCTAPFRIGASPEITVIETHP